MSGEFGKRNRGGHLDVRAFFDSGVLEGITRIIDLGCMVSLGSTRDRGAIGVTVTQDGEWEKEYFRNAADAIEWLEGTISVLGASNGASVEVVPPARQRVRRTR